MAYTGFISKYDLELFAAILLSDKKAPADAKHYASNVAANICMGDAEVLEAVADEINLSFIDPIKTLKNALSRFPDELITSRNQHFAKLFDVNTNVLYKTIWEAQLQSFYSLVEVQLIQLIEKWNDNIRDTLANHTITQYGEHITEPNDVELGTLFFMISTQSQIGKYILYIPDEYDRKRIRFLRDFRNNLAHSVMSEPECVTKFLSDI